MPNGEVLSLIIRSYCSDKAMYQERHSSNGTCKWKSRKHRLNDLDLHGPLASWSKPSRLDKICIILAPSPGDHPRFGLLLPYVHITKQIVWIPNRYALSAYSFRICLPCSCRAAVKKMCAMCRGVFPLCLIPGDRYRQYQPSWP